MQNTHYYNTNFVLVEYNGDINIFVSIRIKEHYFYCFI